MSLPPLLTGALATGAGLAVGWILGRSGQDPWLAGGAGALVGSAIALLAVAGRGPGTARQSAIDAMPDAVAVLDGDGRLLAANHNLLALLGQGIDVLRGRLLSEISEPGAPVVQVVAALRHSGRPVRCDWPLRGPDGLPLPCELSLALCAWGGPGGLLAVWRDQRERLAIEVAERAATHPDASTDPLLSACRALAELMAVRTVVVTRSGAGDSLLRHAILAAWVDGAPRTVPDAHLVSCAACPGDPTAGCLDPACSQRYQPQGLLPGAQVRGRLCLPFRNAMGIEVGRVIILHDKALEMTPAKRSAADRIATLVGTRVIAKIE